MPEPLATAKARGAGPVDIFDLRAVVVEELARASQGIADSIASSIDEKLQNMESRFASKEDLATVHARLADHRKQIAEIRKGRIPTGGGPASSACSTAAARDGHVPKARLMSPGMLETALPLSQRSTLVVGGFPTDTYAKVINTALEQLLQTVPPPIRERCTSHFAPYKRGSVGSLRFADSEAMWNFIKQTPECRPTVHLEGEPTPVQLWMSVQKSPDERKVAHLTNIALKFVRSAAKPRPGESQQDIVVQTDADYTRGIVWLGRDRIATLPSGGEALELNTAIVQASGRFECTPETLQRRLFEASAL